MAMTWSGTTADKRNAASLAIRLWAFAIEARRLSLDVEFVEVGSIVSDIQITFGLTDSDMLSADGTS